MIITGDDSYDDLLAKMHDSVLCVILYSSTPDLKLAIEVGVAVLLDKKIIVHDIEGTAPAKLLALADELVVGSLEDPQTAADMGAAIFRLADRDGIFP